MALICERCASRGKRVALETVGGPSPEGEKVKKPGDKFPSEISKPMVKETLRIVRCPECGAVFSLFPKNTIWNRGW